MSNRPHSISPVSLPQNAVRTSLPPSASIFTKVDSTTYRSNLSTAAARIMSTSFSSKKRLASAFNDLYERITSRSTAQAPEVMNTSMSSSLSTEGGSSTFSSSIGTAASSVNYVSRSSTTLQSGAPTFPGNGGATLASQVATAELTTSTALSFCLATSLASFKSLTWEQTPWAPHKIGNEDEEAVNPLTHADALTIRHHLNSHLSGIDALALRNSLFFGSAYPTGDAHVGPMGTYPHVFVVFPHAKTNVATDARFLRIWHDQIIKPAFDRAWRDSGLAAKYGSEVDGMTRILRPTGVRTANDALPSTGFLKRLENQNLESVRAYWPCWSEEQSCRRVEVMSEAWDAIKGMLKDHPDLPEFQDPILLVVSRGGHIFSRQVGLNQMYSDVGHEWDKYVDPQYLVPKSFKVTLATVMEYPEELESASDIEETYGSYMVDPMMNTHRNNHSIAPDLIADHEMREAAPTPLDDGVDKKRSARDQNSEEDEDEHRGKRRKGKHVHFV